MVGSRLLADVDDDDNCDGDDDDDSERDEHDQHPVILVIFVSCKSNTCTSASQNATESLQPMHVTRKHEAHTC